jgi:hypothetical protein
VGDTNVSSNEDLSPPPAWRGRAEHGG